MDNEHEHTASDGLSNESRASLNPVLQPGEGIGNFRVTKCLCAGLIANYYSMQHVRDLHEVTVAVLHERIRKHPESMRRLSLLQKKIQILDHEGVPKINEYSEVDGKICLFMDPVSGQSLGEYLSAEAPSEGLGPEGTTRVLAQLLGLLGYIHTQGVDHRDIDSDMVYIREDGSVSLLGIGLKATIGVELFEEVVSASVSPLKGQQAAMRLTSFDVMSPEYKSGIDEDWRVDIYQLGIIGFWLLTGQKPDLGHYKKPSELSKQVGKHWDDLMEQMLQRESESRYQSCRAVLLALREENTAPQTVKRALIQGQIDRIPVPRKIRDRGRLATRIYRLSIIGLIGVPLVALAAQFMISTFLGKEDASEAEFVQKVIGQEEPQLQILFKPEAAKVDFIGSDKSFFPRDGRLDLKIQPGDYKVRVSAPGYIAKQKSVTIDEDADFLRKLTFRLEEDLVQLEILSEPDAAVILVDENGNQNKLGRTNEEGRFEIKERTPKGAYRILVAKEGYETIELNPEEIKGFEPPEDAEAGDLASAKLPLTALPSTLTIRTEPAGAQIRMDDASMGESPATIEGLEAGTKLTVAVELKGYRPMTETVEIKPGADQVVDFGALIPRSGEIVAKLRFEGVDSAAAEAMRDDVVIRVGETSYPIDSKAIKFVPQGFHRIRAEHPLYISDFVEETIQDGKTFHLSFTLKPRPAHVNLILPDALEAEVRSGRRILEMDDGRFVVPSQQDVELEVRIRDHLTIRRVLKLAPTESIDWKIDPVPIGAPKKGEDWFVPYAGVTMVWVPAGGFVMGSPMPEQGRLPNEGELTPVTFTRGFWAGAYEVTQAQYAYVMKKNPAEFSGQSLPVEHLTWAEAVRFCERLSGLEREAGRLPEGYVFRLPTEAEWEYAARAGTNTPFHFGEHADASRGNFRGVYPRDFEAGLRTPDSYGTVPVGKFEPNAYGLYDVHGNVREWTLDAYNGRLPGTKLVDPDPRGGQSRYAVRGGSWEDNAVRVRSAVREAVSDSTKSNSLGFRVFLAPEK